MAFVKALRTPMRHVVSNSEICVRTLVYQHKKPLVLLLKSNFTSKQLHLGPNTEPCGTPLLQLRLKSSRNTTIINNSRCLSVLCWTHNRRNLLQGSKDDTWNSRVQFRRGISTDPSIESEFNPIQSAQTIFENFHDVTGLPWWAAIVVTTISLRLVFTLPVAIYSKHVSAKAEKLQPEIMARSMQSFARRYGHRAKAEKWSEERIKKVVFIISKPHSRELYIRDNCHPNKGLVIILVQLPLWICMSLSLRNMSGFKFGSTLLSDPGMAIAEFASGGVLWFQDLTLPDQYLIFPILFGVLNLLNIEMQALSQKEMMSTQKHMMRLMRVVSLVMIPIASYVPVAMSMYWASSASYSTCQNILLRLPSTRHLLGMPRTKNDSDTPFQDMQRTFVQRYLKRGDGQEQFAISEMEKQVGSGDSDDKKK